MKEQAQRAALDKVAKLILLEAIFSNEKEKPMDRIMAIEAHNEIMRHNEPEKIDFYVKGGFLKQLQESMKGD